jgi:O-methyltransferase domain/Dimerisation domain
MDAQQASLELMRLINGYQISQVIHVAASFGIPDLLKDGPRPSAEIAEATGAHARSMHRLLCALASAGVVEEQPDSRFSLTDIGECLRSDSPHSRVAWARQIGRSYAWQAWGELRHSVTTGEPAFEHLHGVRLWEWRAERPEETRIAGAAQSEVSVVFSNPSRMPSISRSSRASSMSAAGRGSFWAASWPGTQEARESCTICRRSSLARRRSCGHMVSLTGARRSVEICSVQSPPAAMPTVLSRVLLDHEDAKVSTILRACRSAMGASGRLIVIERITEPNRPQLMLVDITMLVMTGGRERTLAEFTTLFAEAGFELEQTVVTRSPFTMLVAAPV